MSHVAIELVSHEHAVLDDVPGLRRHALVVITDGGEPEWRLLAKEGPA
jgi:hypothetical protein